MSEYTSYYLYQKYQRRGTGEWTPVSPSVYSIDGEGTMPLSIKNENDPACGYIPPVEPTYRWINMDISTDWICDGTDKYYKQKKQVSYDSGTTWQDVVPAEYQKGSLYELDSLDCGSIEIERWVNSGTTCSGTSGYDKYNLQIKQISYDGGSTWTTTSDYQLGTLIQRNSPDCGYVPPTIDGKFYAEYLNSTTYSAECDSSSVLTSGETRPSGYESTAMTFAIIGSCVTIIDDYAFGEKGYNTSYRSLESVIIPNSVTTIGDYAFDECESLIDVTFPSGLTSIGYEAFSGCKSITNLDIPDSVTTIGNWAFSHCYDLTDVTIGSGVTNMSDVIFYYCTGLTSVTMTNSVTSIGANAFGMCFSLPNITIPSGVTNISQSAFQNCYALSSIDIPDRVTNIGGNAFIYCFALDTVTIGSGITNIGSFAFRSCSGLTSITVNATTPPTLGEYAFYDTNNAPIYVPSTSVNAYKSASGWSTYASRIVAIGT